MIRNPEHEHCPVCGYYCLGNGGLGCIDKPGLIRVAEDDRLQRFRQREEEARAAIAEADGHYRRRVYRGIKLDPYRIALIYDMKGGPREQIMKKCLRFTDKGQTEPEVVADIRKALERWEELLEEDGRNSAQVGQNPVR